MVLPLHAVSHVGGKQSPSPRCRWEPPSAAVACDLAGGGGASWMSRGPWAPAACPGGGRGGTTPTAVNFLSFICLFTFGETFFVGFYFLMKKTSQKEKGSSFSLKTRVSRSQRRLHRCPRRL